MTDITPPDPPGVGDWPPRWARDIGFLVGIGLTVWEAAFDHSAHIIVYGPAFAMTGLPLAQGLESVLTLVLGGLGSLISNMKKGA